MNFRLEYAAAITQSQIKARFLPNCNSLTIENWSQNWSKRDWHCQRI